MSKRNLSMRERSRTQIQKKGKSVPTFQNATEAFLLVQRGRGNKTATLNHYGNTIKKLKRFLAWHESPDTFMDMSEDEILQAGSETKCTVFSSKTVDASFRSFLLDIEEVSEVTVSTYFRDYRAIAYWMMDEDILPPRQIGFKNVEGDIKNCYSDREITRLLKKPDKNCSFAVYRSWVAVHWLLATGNRISTVCNIKIEDVDFDDNMININKQAGLSRQGGEADEQCLGPRQCT